MSGEGIVNAVESISRRETMFSTFIRLSEQTFILIFSGSILVGYVVVVVDLVKVSSLFGHRF